MAELKSYPLWSAGMVIDGTTPTFDLPVNTGPDQYIRSVESLMLASLGARADISFGLYRKSDPTLIAMGGWDHYQDPVGRGDKDHDFGGNYYLVATGDNLKLYMNATPVGPQPSWVTQAAVVLVVRYTLTP